jgi:cytochrome oxidase Cu insertion factor (SCO1/SenC/PrrC family)
VLTACGDTAATIAPVATSQVTASANSTKEMPPVKVAIGFTAPDFTAQTINGETVQLNLLRGKGVIVNFWSVY